MKIVFFGTSAFSTTILQHLLATSHDVIAVVTKPDQPKGRSLKLTPSTVKEWVQAHIPLLPCYEPLKASVSAFVDIMQSLKPDLFVVASYGEIMKTALLEVPRLGPLNVHASLLPQWRGAAPIQRSLMAGEEETGITIMKMVLDLDAGDILDRTKVKVPLDMNHGQLEEALAYAAKEPLLRVLNRLEEGTLETYPQDGAHATYATKIKPADLVIDWSRSALEIHNQIRALSPEPGARTLIEIAGVRKQLKIRRALPIEHPPLPPKQTYRLTSQEWIVGCGKNLLSLLEVQLEGKKNLPIEDFLRGLHHSPRLV